MSLLPPRRPSIQAPAVAASPITVLPIGISEKMLKGRYSDISFNPCKTSIKSSSSACINAAQSNTVVNISNTNHSGNNHSSNKLSNILLSSSPFSSSSPDAALADELDYITVSAPLESHSQPRSPRQVDKASRILGIAHRKSMEPIPASTRTSIVSTRSAPSTPTQHAPTLPLTSLYVVSGLPKSPHTWTLADPDAVLGLSHSEGAVARWWRPEVLGSTVSPGAGGGKKKKKVNKGESTEILKGAGALSKAEVGKMLSKALKAGCYRMIPIAADPFSYSSRSRVKLKLLHQRFSQRAQSILLHLPFLRLPLRSHLHPLKWVYFAHLSSQGQIVPLQPPHSHSLTLMTHSSMPVLHRLI